MIDGMNFTCGWNKQCLCYTEGENATYECCKRGRASDICGRNFTRGDARYRRCQRDHGKYATCLDKDTGVFQNHCRGCPPKSTTPAPLTTTPTPPPTTTPMPPPPTTTTPMPPPPTTTTTPTTPPLPTTTGSNITGPHPVVEINIPVDQ